MKILYRIPGNLVSGRSYFCWNTRSQDQVLVVRSDLEKVYISIYGRKGQIIDTRELKLEGICKYVAWNKDRNVLAMLVSGVNNKYFVSLWSFDHPACTIVAEQNKDRGSITTISWSKLSNTLAMGFSTGGCLLYDKDSGMERYIKDSLMNSVRVIDWSDCLDLLTLVGQTNEFSLTTIDNRKGYYRCGIGSGIIRSVKFSFIPHQITCVLNNDIPPASPLEKQCVPEIDNNMMINNMIIADITKHKSTLLETASFLWISLVDRDRSIIFKPIKINEAIFKANKLHDSNLIEIDNSDFDISYNFDGKSPIVDYHWLDNRYLLIAHAPGQIVLASIDRRGLAIQRTQLFFINGQDISELDNQRKDSQRVLPRQEIRSLQLLRLADISSSAQLTENANNYPICTVAIGLPYSVMICDMYLRTTTPTPLAPTTSGSGKDPNDYSDGNNVYMFEKLDYLNLEENLMKLSQEIESLSWSGDGKLLTIQITDGSVIIFRVRLPSIVLHSYGTRLAYLSEDREVTIIECKQVDQKKNRPVTGTHGNQNEDGAGRTSINIVNIEANPTSIAIGPRHLAVALNNCVWYYMTSKSNLDVALVNKRNYVSIVSSIQLNSRMAAVLFTDGRLQLHPIRATTTYTVPLQQPYKINSSTSSSSRQIVGSRNSSYDMDDEIDDVGDGDGDDDGDDDGDGDDVDRERFFPDPSSARRERILSVALTESSFIYSTDTGRLVTFSLRQWRTIQTYIHSNSGGSSSQISSNPSNMIRSQQQQQPTINIITKVVSNLNGTLLILIDNKNGAFVYSFIDDSLVSFAAKNDHFQRIVNKEEDNNPIHTKPLPLPIMKDNMAILWQNNNTGLSYGETFIVVGEVEIHVFVYIYDSFVGPMVNYVARTTKAISHNVLIFSKGTVSCHTSLGKLFNMILESHDTSKQLQRLEYSINNISKERKTSLDSLSRNDNDTTTSNVTATHSIENKRNMIVGLKLNFIKMISRLRDANDLYNICEYLTSDNSFNPHLTDEGDLQRAQTNNKSSSRPGHNDNDELWHYLARFALFMMDLPAAHRIYRKLNRTDCVECLQKMRQPDFSNELDKKTVVVAYISMILGLKELAQENLTMCPKTIRSQMIELTIACADWDEAAKVARLLDQNKLPLIYYKKALQLEIEEQSYKAAYELYNKASSINKILNRASADFRFRHLSFRCLCGMARCCIHLSDFNRALSLVHDRVIPLCLTECEKNSDSNQMELKNFVQDIAQLFIEADQLDKASNIFIAINDYNSGIKYKLMLQQMDDFDESLIDLITDQSILLDCSRFFIRKGLPNKSIDLLQKLLSLQSVHGNNLKSVNIIAELVTILLNKFNDPTHAMKFARQYKNQEAIDKVKHFLDSNHNRATMQSPHDNI